MALVLSQAIRKIGDVNLVITGQFTSDGNTGQVPAEMAEMLGIAQASLYKKRAPVEIHRALIFFILCHIANVCRISGSEKSKC